MSLSESVIGFLAPPVCVECGAEGRSICFSCAKEIQPFGERCYRCSALSSGYKTCSSCRATGSPNRVFVVSIHEGLARQLLHAYKFDQQRAASLSIARMMTDLLKLSHHGKTLNYTVVPIPTASSRVRERGFDHSILLAKHISKSLGLSCASALKRIGQSRQVGASRPDRQKQMSGNFRVVDSRIRGKRILLVDDVVTTGATLNEASKVLRLAGAGQVDALVFAKRL